MVIEVPKKVLNSDKLNVNNTLFFFQYVLWHDLFGKF